MWLSLWYLLRVPAAIMATTAVVVILLRRRSWGIRLMAISGGLIVLVTSCYPVTIASVVIIQEALSKPMKMAANVIQQDYKLRISEYRPEEGGTNCDADCTMMASGDLVATWVGGRDGIYAAACPREWGWRHGEQFAIDGTIFECRDTGGWINCYEPGEMDVAIVNAHSKGYMRDVPAVAEERYCWVDLLGTWGIPYGTLVSEWGKVRMVATGGNDNPFLPYRGIRPQPLNGTHGVGQWPGRDYLTPAGTPLYAPEICPCRVVRSGLDSYVGPFGSFNSFIHLQSLDGVWDVVYMHGRYTAAGVVAPGQSIGSEASIGNSTDPHSHVSVRRDGVLVDPEDY